MTIFIAIKRYLAILAAYLVAVALSALGVGLSVTLSTGDSSLGFIPIAGFGGIIIGFFAAVPAALVVLLAEHRSIRSIWYYIAFAAVAGMALGQVVGREFWLALLGLALGFAAGAAYWLIAGRNAGILKASEAGRAHTHLLLLLGSTGVIAIVLLVGLWH